MIEQLEAIEEVTLTDRRVYPPHVLVFSVFASITLCFFSEIRIFDSPLPGYFGALLSIFGIWLVISCRKLFIEFETEITPFKESSTLLQLGPYSYSRNPIYLGMTLVLLGICLQLNDPLPFLVPLIFFIWVNICFVLPEEKMMREVYGDQFVEYTGKVRRWL
jgi:protein-S-isoprenylcysteine O-methyltransferase Ste14